MAVIIVQNPTNTGGGGGGLIPVTNCIKWIIQMIGVETETECKTLKYQLCDDQGNEISSVQTIQPPEGVFFPLSFEKDIKSYFEVKPPLGNGTNPLPFENKVSVLLKYWEVTTTKTLPCTTTEGAKMTDGNYDVINAGDNWFCRFNENRPLNIKPELMEVCRDTKDWLYFCKGGTVGAVLYDSKGQTVGDFGPLTVSDDNYVGVGPGNIYPDGVPAHIECIEVYGPGINYKYVFCCCKDSHIDIHFQSILGGFSTMSFNETESITLTTSQSEVCRNSSFCRKGLSIWTEDSGFRISEKTIFKKYSLKKTIEAPDSLRQQAFFQDFFTSCVYYITVNDNKTEVSSIRIPFILDPGNFKIMDKKGCFELNVTGYIPIPTNKPSSGF